MQSPWAGRLYTDAKARGKRNPHATRIVARARLRVIWACWHNATPYDPDRHTAAGTTWLRELKRRLADVVYRIMIHSPETSLIPAG